MKKNKSALRRPFRGRGQGWGLFLALICAGFQQVQAQGVAAAEPFLEKDSVTRNAFTIIFINKQKGFDTAVKNKLVEVYFKVYPQMANDFNPNTSKKVNFIIDPKYTGIAEAGGNTVRFNPKWFDGHPNDIDVVTHEVMHIIQSYGHRAGPWWITEGIADYVRYKYGVANEAGGWSLTPFSPDHHYNKGYRITARFFAWMEKQHPGFVKKLDGHMRAHTYTAATCTAITGKTLDEWWQQYALNPVL